MYKGNARTLFQGILSQKHFFLELRGIDFAANTMITFPEITWEESLSSGGDHRAIRTAVAMVRAGINAGLRFVDANGEAADAFFVRTGTSLGVLCTQAHCSSF